MGMRVARLSEMLVRRLIEAFNARDLDGVLACSAKGVDLRPLRLSGLAGRYHGHEGVREWFVQLQVLGYEHQIALTETRDVGEGTLLATGSLSLGGEDRTAPFCGVHHIRARPHHRQLRVPHRAPDGRATRAAPMRDRFNATWPGCLISFNTTWLNV